MPVPASRRTEAAERRAAFWRTPGGRVLGVVSFVMHGLLGTRQLITHSTAALVAFGIFVLVTVALSLSRDPRARVGVIGVSGIYFAVAGFAHFGGLHNTLTGSLGISSWSSRLHRLSPWRDNRDNSMLVSLTVEGRRRPVTVVDARRDRHLECTVPSSSRKRFHLRPPRASSTSAGPAGRAPPWWWWSSPAGPIDAFHRSASPSRRPHTMRPHTGPCSAPPPTSAR